jgi:EAL domain-containing protein (putative c-di-GMP-specific phosphodiesterase class I)
MLLAQGCDQVQGYYFSWPVASDAFERVLQERSRLLSLG